MKYHVEILPRVEKRMNTLSKSALVRINGAIKALQAEPRPPGVARVKVDGTYRVRVGDYRIVYDINDAARLITITGVGHSKDVYR